MITVYTHNGKFHADEVFATAVLKLALGKIEVIRTRQITDDILQNHIVYDVGNSQFDHHESNLRQHADGTPMAAFGLIWEHFGQQALRRHHSLDAKMLQRVFEKVEDHLVTSVDAADNGIAQDAFTISNVISDVPTFNAAVIMATTILNNRIEKAVKSAKDEFMIRETLVVINDDTIFLPYSGSWRFLIDERPNLKFVVYKNNNDQFNIQAASLDRNSMTPRQELSPELENYDGFIFRHKAGFLAAFKTKEQALFALEQTK